MEQEETQKQGSKMNMSVPLSIVLAGVIVAGAIIFVGARGSTVNVGEGLPKEQAPAEIHLADITPEDHVLGSRDADVMIVEFSDLECPFCKTFHNTMKSVIEEYGEDGKVAWVFRHFPLESLHAKARDEALASECVAALGGEVAFWEYIDMIFETTPSNDGLDLSLLPQFAEDVGVDRAQFEQCMESRELEKRIDEDIQEALDAGARGTPHSVIVPKNGDPIPLFGARPLGEVRAIIEEALSNI